LRQGWRIRLRPQVLADLRLWLSFLHLAHRGISLNLISFRTPTHVFQSDALDHGIGGFCAISRGGAWSLEILTDCGVGCQEGISALNLFEFLGGIISVWVEIRAGRVPPGSCLLAQGDSTSETGWLKKSNFRGTNHPLQLEVARHLAFLLLDAQVILYSQSAMLRNASQCSAMLRNAPQCSAMLRNASQCFAMLRNASQCFAMLRNASQCFAMLRNASQCFTMLHNASQCFAMLRNASQCFVMLRNASQCSAMLRNASQCFAMLRNASQCSAMLRNASQCFAMLRNASQCFAEKENGTSDVLFRDTHLTATALTDLLHSSIPEQVPPNFSICPLPPPIYF
jgi:hypothetical protein